VVAAIVVLMGSGLSAVDSRAEAPSLAGAWTLNKELSDQPRDSSAREGGGDRGGSRGGMGRGGGGHGGGGRGGGFGGRGGGFGGGGVATINPEDAARIRDAMRDITNPPDHLLVTQTESMIVITSQDGRTTRLSPDGKKIKDENTKIERKTKWEGEKLVIEITGLPGGNFIQSYVVDRVDPAVQRLHVTVQMEARNGNPPRTITHIYDRESSASSSSMPPTTILRWVWGRPSATSARSSSA
jgi:hypothetical protein